LTGKGGGGGPPLLPFFLCWSLMCAGEWLGWRVWVRISARNTRGAGAVCDGACLGCFFDVAWRMAGNPLDGKILGGKLAVYPGRCKFCHSGPERHHPERESVRVCPLPTHPGPRPAPQKPPLERYWVVADPPLGAELNVKSAPAWSAMGTAEFVAGCGIEKGGGVYAGDGWGVRAGAVRVWE